MNKKIVFVLVAYCLLVVGGVFVSGFQGSSSSFTSDNRIDSFSETNASSASFTQRLIGGIQTVGEYVTSSFSGRFGILEESVVGLVINVTSHINAEEVIRGNDATAGEDDKGFVDDSVNLTARVFDETNNNAFSGANCFFFDETNSLGNTTTNANGFCTINYTKSSLSLGSRNISINYTISTSDTISTVMDQVNITIIQYLSDLELSNLQSDGKYLDGDTAVLLINITKTNLSGTQLYDPQNISANATNAAETVYANGDLLYPGEIARIGTGQYQANITVNYSFGAQVRWDVLVSEGNFSDLLSTAVHADKEICAGDFGEWSEFSACSGGVKTRTRTDSSGCTQVETSTDGCGTTGGGGGCDDDDNDGYCDTVDCNDNDASINPGASEICSDNIDNDCDNDIDCLDGECLTNPICQVQEAICDDGIDNDNDGDIDCSDSDCNSDPICGCVPNWVCDSWGSCQTNETQLAFHSDSNQNSDVNDGLVFEQLSANNLEVDLQESIVAVSIFDEVFDGFSITGRQIFNLRASNCETLEEFRCHPTRTNRYQVCEERERRNDIVLRWRNYRVPNGMACVDNQLSCSEDNACTIEDASQCTNGRRFQVCQEDANGCLKWSNRDADGSRYQCARGLACVGGECACTSNNACNVEGIAQCTSSTRFQVCEPDANGCLKWTNRDSSGDRYQCTNGLRCSGQGECGCPVTNSCDAEGASRCTNTRNFQVCELNTNGCLQWTNRDSNGDRYRCDRGETCSQGQCISGNSRDSDVCTEGDTTCIGNSVYSCQPNNNGIDRWVRTERCTGGTSCSEGSCIVSHCFDGVMNFNEEGTDCGGSCGECTVESQAECISNSDCGAPYVTEQCSGDDIQVNNIAPVCISGVCQEQTDIGNIICEFGCSNNQCNSDPSEETNQTTTEGNETSGQTGSETNETTIEGNETMSNQTTSNQTTTVSSGGGGGRSSDDDRFVMDVGETKQVTIKAGDDLSVTYEERTGNSVSIKVKSVSTGDSTSVSETHTIRVDEIRSGSIRVTVSSDPVTEDIPIGGTQIFSFGTGSGEDGSASASSSGNGVQECLNWVDLNQCGTEDGKPTEEQQQCILDLTITYFPQQLFLIVGPGATIPFSATAESSINDLISLQWFRDGGFQIGNSGTFSVSGDYTDDFEENADVELSVGLGGLSQEVDWQVEVDPNIDPNCVEDWYCTWEPCNEEGIKLAIDCQDLNACGSNIYEPKSKSCACIPDFECGEWSECTADYGLDDLVSGATAFEGQRFRVCEDRLLCENNTIEYEGCSLAVPVNIEKSQWCFEEYIEIYNAETNELVSRVKDFSTIGLKRLDIGLIVTDFQGYCSYCFDGIKNFDEEGVDCGGSGCAECINKGFFFDWLFYMKLALWLLLLLLLLWLIYKNRQRIKALVTGAPAEIKEVKHDITTKPRSERERAIERPGRKLSLGKMLSGLIPRISISFKPKKRIARLPEVEVPKVPKVKVPEVVIPRVRKPAGDLSRKLAEWKRRGYYTTAALERKLRRYRESSKFKREQRAREKALKKRRKAIEKARIKEQKLREKQKLAIEKQRATEARRLEKQRAAKESIKKPRKGRFKSLFGILSIRRKHNKSKRKEEKSKKREEKRKKKAEREAKRKARRAEKKVRRKHKKVARKEARHLKRKIRRKQVSRSELPSLRKKLKDWKNKGYYDTTRLQRKLDKYERRKPWE